MNNEPFLACLVMNVMTFDENNLGRPPQNPLTLRRWREGREGGRPELSWAFRIGWPRRLFYVMIMMLEYLDQWFLFHVGFFSSLSLVFCVSLTRVGWKPYALSVCLAGAKRGPVRKAVAGVHVSLQGSSFFSLRRVWKAGSRALACTRKQGELQLSASGRKMCDSFVLVWSFLMSRLSYRSGVFEPFS